MNREKAAEAHALIARGHALLAEAIADDGKAPRRKRRPAVPEGPVDELTQAEARRTLAERGIRWRAG